MSRSHTRRRARKRRSHYAKGRTLWPSAIPYQVLTAEMMVKYATEMGWLP